MRRAVPTLAVAAALMSTACGQTVQVDPTLVSDVAPVPKANGLAVTAYGPDAYATTGPRTFDRLKALGATDVQLIPRWQTTSRTGSSVTPEADSPTEGDVTAGVRAAKARGLRVIVKPHVDVRDGTYRGDIAPEQRDMWWRDYRDYVVRFAGAAATGGADGFVVGTELTSMSRDTAQWRALIRDVRKVFRGPVLFAANWDAIDDVAFWDALDAIGVDAYYPLDEGDLAGSWRTVRAQLERTVRRWQRPIVFTEVGYPSETGAAAHPFEEQRGTPDQEAQADLYRAVFAAFDDAPWWRGAYWWDWRADGSAPTPTGYEPTGKAAERVLQDAWR